MVWVAWAAWAAWTCNKRASSQPFTVTPDAIRGTVPRESPVYTGLFLCSARAPHVPYVVLSNNSAEACPVNGIDATLYEFALHKFNFQHEHIARDDSKSWLDFAFEHDFAVNGPSLYRIMRTMYEGWKRYGQDSDARARARFSAEADKLRLGYGAALWAMQRYLRGSNQTIRPKFLDIRAYPRVGKCSAFRGGAGL